MELTYGKEGDALHVRASNDEHECRAINLGGKVALDFGLDERLVGLEALGASRLFARPDVPEVELDNLAGKPISR